MSHAIAVHALHNARDFRAAMTRLDQLADLEDVKPGTPEGDELEVLSVLIEAYELEHSPISDPDPLEAIRFRLDQLGMKSAALAPILGGRSRVSELFSGRRRISLRMIQRLRAELGISADALIPPPESGRRRVKRAGTRR